MSEEISRVEARSPREIAELVNRMGIAKARTDWLTLLVLSVLAGAYISLGSLLFTVVVTGSELGFGITRLIGGLAFSLGLILVVVGGAELFTGNNLIAMAWASRQLTTLEVLRHWVIVYVGNVVGCLATVALVVVAGVSRLHVGAVGQTAIQIARAKVELNPDVAFARGVLCNALVCLAVWLALGGRSVSDKIMAVMLPVAAFVTLGLEHSIANWFFIPYAWVLVQGDGISIFDALIHLSVVTGGNLVGGTLLVASVYWLAYLRSDRTHG